jgi:hypothetical protein
MLSRNMQQGALMTREAYLALLDLKSVVESAVEKTRCAGFHTIGMAVDPKYSGDPLATLNSALEALRSERFEGAVAEARNKVETAAAWLEARGPMNEVKRAAAGA